MPLPSAALCAAKRPPTTGKLRTSRIGRSSAGSATAGRLAALGRLSRIATIRAPVKSGPGIDVHIYQMPAKKMEADPAPDLVWGVVSASPLACARTEGSGSRSVCAAKIVTLLSAKRTGVSGAAGRRR